MPSTLTTPTTLHMEKLHNSGIARRVAKWRIAGCLTGGCKLSLLLHSRKGCKLELQKPLFLLRLEGSWVHTCQCNRGVVLCFCIHVPSVVSPLNHKPEVLTRYYIKQKCPKGTTAFLKLDAFCLTISCELCNSQINYVRYFVSLLEYLSKFLSNFTF